MKVFSARGPRARIAATGALFAVVSAVLLATNADAASTSAYDNIMVTANHGGSVLVFNMGQQANCVPLVPGQWVSSGIPAGVGEGVAFTVTMDNTTCANGQKYDYTAPENPQAMANWWVTLP